VLRYPEHQERADESQLDRYLAEASALADAVGASDPTDATISPDFDSLRWFELPAGCLV